MKESKLFPFFAVLPILLIVSLVLIMFFAPKSDDVEGNTIYISGRIKLEEDQVIRFKEARDGSISGYITYEARSGELIVKKVTINNLDEITYHYDDKSYSSLIYKANKDGDELKGVELYLSLGEDTKGRILGIGLE